MSVRTRLRQAVTTPALLGCLVVAVSAPPVTAHAASAPIPLPAFELHRGTFFRATPPTAELPVSGYHITGTFGSVSSLWSTVHTGLDFATAYGTPIHAIESGVVIEASYDGAYGNKTVVRLADGTELWFCHQSAQVVQVGDRLRVGDLIGYVGTTGNTTGPHLHLEVHPRGGNAVDPYAALVRLGLHP